MSKVPLYVLTAVLEGGRFPIGRHVSWNTSSELSPGVQGYLAHKKQPSPQGRHRSLGIGLLQGPVGFWFPMSEVPLYVT